MRPAETVVDLDSAGEVRLNAGAGGKIGRHVTGRVGTDEGRLLGIEIGA